MNVLTNLIASTIIAAWLGIATILAIQNVQPVSLQFLWFKSINFPVGVLSIFTLSLGLMIGSLVPLLWSSRRSTRSKRSLNRNSAGWETGSRKNW